MRSLQIRIEDVQRALVKFTITALSKQPPHQMFAVVVLLRRWSAHHRLFEVHITVKNKVDRRLACNINVKTVRLMFSCTLARSRISGRGAASPMRYKQRTLFSFSEAFNPPIDLFFLTGEKIGSNTDVMHIGSS